MQFLERLRSSRYPWKLVIPLLLLILLLFGWILGENNRRLQSLKEEEAALRLELTASQSEEQSLKVKLANVSSTGSMDSEARAMSFVKPGEICFEIVNP